MNRRSFLTACGAAVALSVVGCLDDPDNEPQDTPPDNSSDTAGSAEQDSGPWRPNTELPELPPGPPVASFETEPLTVGVPDDGVSTNDRFRVAVRSVEGATEEHPAAVAIVLSNRHAFEQTIRPRRLLVLDDPTVLRNGDRGTMVLAPTEAHPLAEQPPAYEQDDTGRWRVSETGGDWYPDQLTVPPESGLVASYHLLGPAERSEPVIEPGRYETNWRGNSLGFAVWPTNQPGPSETAAFAGADPGPLDDNDQMAWYHDAAAVTETYLRPSQESVSLPAAVDATFVNHSTEAAGGNPAQWRLHKRVDGTWYPIEPWEWADPYQSIPPGGQDETRLALFAGDPIDIGGARTVGHLGPGQYAYEIGFSVEDETHAFLIDVDAPELPIDPPDDATLVEDGEQRVVQGPDYAAARRRATLTLERVDNADPQVRILPEQLPRRPFLAYRSGFPMFEDGVEQVTVRTTRRNVRQVLEADTESLRFRYDGRTYEAAVTVDDE